MKKIVAILLAVFIIGSTFNTRTIFALEEEVDIDINAKSAILIEPSTGTVIYEKNAHEKLKPASVTKIMTILLIYDAVASKQLAWDDKVTVSEHAASMGGSQVFLEPNEVQTVADLLKCIVIASANDGAVAMAEKIGGSEEGFVNLMNEKAKMLGMKDTHFVNPSGLDVDDHYTSAYDIALMSKALITNYPEVFDISTIWQDSITHHTRRGAEEFGLTNTNKLLKWYDGATGLKTGSTSKAKYCLSGTAKRNDMDLIAVVMAAPDYKTRFKEVMRMFDYGFSVCKKYTDTISSSYNGEIAIKGGVVDKISVKPKNDFNIVVTEKGFDPNSIEKKIELSENVDAPIKKHQVVGKISYTHKGKALGSVELVAEQGVMEADFKFYFMKILKNYLN